LGRDNATRYTIVGVVKDVKFYNLGDEPTNQTYVSFAQAPSPLMSIVVHTATEPMKFSTALQETVWALDKEQPISGVQTLQSRIDNEEAPIRIFTQFAAYFALLALFLAGIGIYGVMAYVVESRTREIGIRIACGAERGNIMWLVLAGSLKLAAVGVFIGLMGAWGVAQLLMSQLYGVKTNNLDVYAVSMAVLCVAILFATLVPIRRATRVDPLTVLRCE
jgi:putative ABC transport system permease protein